MADSKKAATGRASLAHLADKFNTAPPPGYVAGRGRGVAGFSKPSADDLKHARGPSRTASAGAAATSAAGSSSNGGGGSALQGDASDTRNLDLGETERFEEADLSMDSKEAGNTIEAFSMSSERQDGHFDDDFNFVWKKKEEKDAEIVRDAWLGEVDASTESAEKVEKRRKLLRQHLVAEQQRAMAANEEQSKVDTPATLAKMVGMMKPGETVAAALRRLGSSHSDHKAGKAGGGSVSGGKRKLEAPDDAENALRRKEFEELTEAADALLRDGRYDIYTEKYEALQEEAATAAAPAQGGDAGASADATASEAHSLGIDAQTHAMAVAGGFVLNAAHRVYYNVTSGLYFDPSTSLYWSAPTDPGSNPQYFYWDAASSQFVPAQHQV